MYYTNYTDVLKAKAFEKAVAVNVQSKDLGLHQGHIDLINYAKTLGTGKVVVLFSDTRWIFRYLLFGELNNRFPPPEQEILDAENLGVDSFYQEFPLLKEEERLNILQVAVDKTRPYEKELIIQKKIYLCQIFACVIEARHILGDRYNKFDYILEGVDIPYFFAKAIYEKDSSLKKFPGNKILYPFIHRDSSTGVMHQTAVNFLDSQEIEESRELRNIIDNEISPNLTKGLNSNLIEKINTRYSDRTWKFVDIVLYEGGIFGSSKLEYYSIGFPRPFPNDARFLIEDLKYTP